MVTRFLQGKEKRNDSSLLKWVCCSESHKVYQCKMFWPLALPERWKIVMYHKLCKLCLNSDHLANSCSLGNKCKKKDCCNNIHNTLLHPSESRTTSEAVENSDANTDKVPEVKTLATLSNSKNRPIERNRDIYLDIVPVKVELGDTAIHSYALLDSSSDRMLCEPRLADELSLGSSSVKLAV